MNQVAVWTPRPQEVSYLVRQQIDGGGFFFNVLARLKPGTTLAAASAQVATIAQAYSLSHPTNADVEASADVTLLLDALVGDQTATYLVLFAAVACLLLIASANVANLSLVLALVGGAAGVALAQLTLGVVKQWAGDRIPRVEEVALDPAVLLFSLGVSLFVGLLLGLLPAWQVAKSRESNRRPDAIRIAAKPWCSSTRDSWSGPARFPG